MRVIGLITSIGEAKEIEYIAKVRSIIERIQLLALIGKVRRERKKNFKL